MVNILLEGYDIDVAWLYDELKHYIRSEYSVVVIPFAFRENRVRSAVDWDALYSKANGKYYSGIVSGFAAYGISEKNITFVNYFADTKDLAAQKIKSADIVYFLGGLPDKMFDRIMEFDLYDVLLNYQGIVMGYSAGAVIQLAEYHLSPDEDYSEFKYGKGVPYLDSFYVQVHYEENRIQNESIRRVISERKKTVYALSLQSGAILVDNGTVKLIGDVKVFTI